MLDEETEYKNLQIYQITLNVGGCQKSNCFTTLDPGDLEISNLGPFMNS